MKSAPLATLMIGFFLFSNTALAASIPPMPEMDTATAAAKLELVGRRDAFVKERNELREKSIKQKSACSDIEEGTPTERDCAAWLTRITGDVERHIQVTNDLAALISSAAGYKAFVLPAIRGEGEVYFLTPDGRKLSGNEAAGVNLDNRTTIFTGKKSKAYMILPDGTSVTVGANFEMVLDDFVYDPNTDIKKMTLKVPKGGFRWVTGKVKRFDPKIELGVINVGIRGTDFECFVDDKGEGFVKLYSGEREITHQQTNVITLLTAGNMLNLNAKEITGSEPIPASV